MRRGLQPRRQGMELREKLAVAVHKAAAAEELCRYIYIINMYVCMYVCIWIDWVRRWLLPRRALMEQREESAVAVHKVAAAEELCRYPICTI